MSVQAQHFSSPTQTYPGPLTSHQSRPIRVVFLSIRTRPGSWWTVDMGNRVDVHSKAFIQRRGGERREKGRKMEWPNIKTKKNLHFNRLKSNDLITVPNLLTPYESKAFIEVAESLGFVHQGSLGPAKGEAYRDNDRISVNDSSLADAMWESGLNKLFADIKIRGKVAVGLNPNIRFYRYKAGQRFGRHIDESVDLGDGKDTQYTLLIYLSGCSKSKGKSDAKSPGDAEPLVGGETVFYGSRNRLVAEVAPEEGMALVHIHGDNCMLHEARNVAKGVKYVLRSDVIFAKSS